MAAAERIQGTAFRRAEDEFQWRSRGYLPHVDAPNLVQHVVFRLADSFSSGTAEKIRGMRAEERVRAADAALDLGHGKRYLADPAIALAVQNALLQFNTVRYLLMAWCIMPNHVHVLLRTAPEQTLDRVVHSWKSFTANQANRLLSRSGPFWAREYFDRFIRDDEHLARTTAYIEGNPVKAALCENVEDWPFSSAASEWDRRLPAGRPARCRRSR